MISLCVLPSWVVWHLIAPGRFPRCSSVLRTQLGWRHRYLNQDALVSFCMRHSNQYSQKVWRSHGSTAGMLWKRFERRLQEHTFAPSHYLINQKIPG
ncbi:uncharacterized protein BDV14DRAFT_100857 [Aspergillus stella-maris]|uniref:uncharacterized protein n=1 Tax=Aspergillus stella-maris TaxID=1810926 RepID=UPI003CCD1278